MIKVKQFEKFAEEIQPVYQFLNWTWHDKGVPTKEQIATTLTELYVELEKDHSQNISTGGLYIERVGLDEGMEEIRFGFIMENFLTSN